MICCVYEILIVYLHLERCTNRGNVHFQRCTMDAYMHFSKCIYVVQKKVNVKNIVIYGYYTHKFHGGAA